MNFNFYICVCVFLISVKFKYKLSVDVDTECILYLTVFKRTHVPSQYVYVKIIHFPTQNLYSMYHIVVILTLLIFVMEHQCIEFCTVQFQFSLIINIASLIFQNFKYGFAGYQNIDTLPSAGRHLCNWCGHLAFKVFFRRLPTTTCINAFSSLY